MWYCWSCSASELCGYLWVIGYGCKFEFVKSLLVVRPFQRSVDFSVQATCQVPSCVGPRRGSSWLPLWR